MKELASRSIMHKVNTDDRSFVPTEDVIFSKRRLEKLAWTLSRPFHKRKRKRYLPKTSVIKEETREFQNTFEEDKFNEEFGPFTNALLDDAEREYCRRRKEEMINSNEFDIDPILDLHTIMICIMDEVILQRLFRLDSEKPGTASVQRQISDVQKRYRENLHILDATRSQRNKAKQAKEELELNKEISIALVVQELEKTKNERLMLERKYKEEEVALLESISSKPAVEFDIVGSVGEDEEEETEGENE